MSKALAEHEQSMSRALAEYEQSMGKISINAVI
jgi:hypothetical protein